MKILMGKVISTKMNKTIVVEVERTSLHPLYKKYLKKTKRYKVHCEDKNIKAGDVVQIQSSKPISKDKHYSLLSRVIK